MTHLLDYLLDHMVSIKVERAILDFSLVEQLLYQHLLLLQVKNLNTSLDNSAAVLVC